MCETYFVSWLYLSRFLWRAARLHPTPPPFFGGGKYKKYISPVASGLAFGHVCVCVGVVSCSLGAYRLCYNFFFDEKKAKSLTVRPGITRFTRASTFCALLARSSSVFSLSGLLSPSSQVSRGALGLLRYDVSERVSSFAAGLRS